MNTHKEAAGRIGSVIKMIVTAVVFTAIVVLSILWLAGAFHRKIDDAGIAVATRPAEQRMAADARIVAARLMDVSRTESATGTIRSVYEIAVASKILAKVTEVNVKAGQKVAKNDILVRLDDADLVARLGQAESLLQEARSRYERTQIEYDRIKTLLEQQAAAQIEWDRAKTALSGAEARVKQAEDAVTEARTLVDYATIRSSIDGVVIDKKVESGDMVSPGQMLLKLYDPGNMQLVADVRESLARRLSVGQTIGVHVEALAKTCQGQVREIVPEAATASRTFAVKVSGPCPPGVYSGMFGRLLIPLGREQVLVVPNNAVRRIGQLTIVDVADGDFVRRRAVQLGRSFGEDVEVLAGLREGERVVLPRL